MQGDAAARPAERSWLCFRVASSEYAVPLDDVAEVGAGRVRYLIPTLSLEVAGIVNLRGEPLPALDGGMLLVGVPCRADRHMLVVERGEQRIGLFVDGVLRIVRDLERDLVAEPAKSDETRYAAGSSCYRARTTLAGKTIRLVDAAVLLERAAALMSDGGSEEGEVQCHTAF
jgi:chemotaxis signal transduction protein